MSKKQGLLTTVTQHQLSKIAGGGGLVFLVASATVGLSNFIFHVVLSRLLGPDQYGALGALLTIVLVLSVPLTALQAAVTRAVALKERDSVNIRRIVIRAAGLSGVAMLVLMGASPMITGFLHLKSAVPVVILATMVPPTAVAAVLQGVLIGRLRFTPVGVALLVGAAVRLLFGVAFVAEGLGVTGAMLAGTLAALATMGIVFWPLRLAIRVPSGRSTS